MLNFVKYNSTYGATGVAEPCKIGEIRKWGQAGRIYSVAGKTVSLKACAGGAGAKTGLYAIEADGTETPVFTVVKGHITYKDNSYPIKLPDGFYIIRKLTVSECMRLQTVPEWYDFSVISQTRAYKCLGNGWTVEVIMHIISQAMQGKTEESYIQLGLF